MSPEGRLEGFGPAQPCCWSWLDLSEALFPSGERSGQSLDSLRVIPAVSTQGEMILHFASFRIRQRADTQERNRLPVALTLLRKPVHNCLSPWNPGRFIFILLSFSRAWCRRDFTVPTEQPRMVAISGREASSKNLSQMMIRCFSGRVSMQRRNWAVTSAWLTASAGEG